MISLTDANMAVSLSAIIGYTICVSLFFGLVVFLVNYEFDETTLWNSLTIGCLSSVGCVSILMVAALVFAPNAFHQSSGTAISYNMKVTTMKLGANHRLEDIYYNPTIMHTHFNPSNFDSSDAFIADGDDVNNVLSTSKNLYASDLNVVLDYDKAKVGDLVTVSAKQKLTYKQFDKLSDDAPFKLHVSKVQRETNPKTYHTIYTDK